MFKNKKILITQPMIRGICGSTMVTLELAEKLQDLGAIVTIYTSDFADPAKSIFEEKHLKVDTFQENPKYKLNDFDYIWVHSQILPISIINSLSNKLPSKIPSFIFLHMSGMDWIPDEKPWIYGLENQLSSLSVFICEEVANVNKPFLDPSIPTAFFRNPTPDEFISRHKKPSKKLTNLLIVSNHPSPEVTQAKELLINNHHINVVSLGENQEQYKVFNKQLLEKYDAIITIAKTVPYCLVSGTPVYVYDIYGGGPGWLNEKNFENAKERNFSGYQNSKYPNYEGGVFHYKTAEQIAQEIIDGYNKSLSFQSEKQPSFIQDFTLNSVLPKLFAKVKPRKISPFTKEYANSAMAAERFAVIRFEVGGSLSERNYLIHDLEHTKDQLAIENQELITKNQQLVAEQQRLKQDLTNIVNSGAYRAFDKIITPYKITKKGLRNVKNSIRRK